MKNARRGGSLGRGGGRARGREGVCGDLGGGGAKYFVSGPKFPPSSTCLDASEKWVSLGIHCIEKPSDWLLLKKAPQNEQKCTVSGLERQYSKMARRQKNKISVFFGGGGGANSGQRGKLPKNAVFVGNATTIKILKVQVSLLRSFVVTTQAPKLAKWCLFHAPTRKNAKVAKFGLFGCTKPLNLLNPLCLRKYTANRIYKICGGWGWGSEFGGSCSN